MVDPLDSSHGFRRQCSRQQFEYNMPFFYAGPICSLFFFTSPNGSQSEGFTGLDSSHNSTHPDYQPGKRLIPPVGSALAGVLAPRLDRSR
jgi:hypothetical protein